MYLFYGLISRDTGMALPGSLPPAPLPTPRPPRAGHAEMFRTWSAWARAVEWVAGQLITASTPFIPNLLKQ